MSAAKLAPVMVTIETKISSGTYTVRNGYKPHKKDAQQHGPRRRLYGDRHESRNAGRRAFVGVGQPLMERDGGNFEEQSGRRGQQRNNRHRTDMIARSVPPER